MAQFVRPQYKGMVTIPSKIRRDLGISTDTLLEVRPVENGVMFVKVSYHAPIPQLYTDQQICQWVKDDKLDIKTARKLSKLLK